MAPILHSRISKAASVSILLAPALIVLGGADAHAQVETACRVSIDDCPSGAGGYEIGVTLIVNPTSEQSCHDKGEDFYDACQLDPVMYPAHAAPPGVPARRVKTEFLTGDATTSVAHYPCLNPPSCGQGPLRGRPLLGVSRFDAWWDGSLYGAKETLIDNPQYQGRLPFYTTINGSQPPLASVELPVSGDIAFSSDSQAVVDQEIDYAVNGGIDFWVFSWWGRWPFSDPHDPPPTPQQALGELHWVNPPSSPPNASPFERHLGPARARHDRSLLFYLTSPKRSRLRMALMVNFVRFGPNNIMMNGTPRWMGNVVVVDDSQLTAALSDSDPTSSWFEQHLEYWVQIAREPEYQTVLGDRPLFFIYGIEGSRRKDPTGVLTDLYSLANYFGSHERARIAIRTIRKRFREAGLGNPYIVGMTPEPASQHDGLVRFQADEWGFDAVSRYSRSLGHTDSNGGSFNPTDGTTIEGGPYSDMTCSPDGPYAEDATYAGIPYLDPSFGLFGRWTQLAASMEQKDKQLIAPLNVGFDPRPVLIPFLTPTPVIDLTLDPPRCDPPVLSFEQVHWSQHAAPGEIGTLLDTVKGWVANHQSQTEANTVLAYSWNELTEGGWLVPTFGDKNDRLAVVRASTCAPNVGGECGAAPVGQVGFVGSGIATGWAYDPDVPNRSIEIHFYVNGPFQVGQFIGSAIADREDPGVNAQENITGNHRFWFPIGYEHHGKPLYAYAVDPVRGSASTLLDQWNGTSMVPPPYVNAPECDNDLDDDGDGKIDFGTNLDSGCSSASDPTERLDCDDLWDNDGDGYADRGVDLNGDGDRIDVEFPPDPRCAAWAGGMLGEQSPGDCADGIDNNGDGRADGIDVDLDGFPETGVKLNDDDDYLDREYEADPGCLDIQRPREDPQCNNGIDDDYDQKVDYDGGPSGLTPDPQCINKPYRNQEAPDCGIGYEIAPILVIAFALRRRVIGRVQP